MVQDVLKIQLVQVPLFRINVLLIDIMIGNAHGMVHVKKKHAIMQEQNIVVMNHAQNTQLLVLARLIMLLDVKIEYVKMPQQQLTLMIYVKPIFQKKIV